MQQFILNPDQEKVVSEALKFLRDDSRQVFEFAGPAGTGKSVVLNEIVRRARLLPSEVIPCAYTGSAANVMRTKGFFNAKSIHSWFYELIKMPKIDSSSPNPFVKYNTEFNTPEFEYKFVPKSEESFEDIKKYVKVIIIDEGYMVPISMKRDILKHGIKVIVAGDSCQLPPIAGEPAFLTGDNVMHLTQLMRQSESNPIVYLANRAREGLPIHCGIYGNKVLVIPDTEFTTQMMLDVGNVVCGTNYSRDFFNKKTREILGMDSNFPMYGERIICRNNNWKREQDGISLVNGLQGVISSPVSMNSFKGKKLTIDFLPDLMSTPFESLTINYKYLMADYNTRQQIKESKFESNNGELFEFAYAITTHLAQGSEYPCGIFYEEFLRSNIQKQLCYTGITRFKEYMIYVKKTRKFY